MLLELLDADILISASSVASGASAVLSSFDLQLAECDDFVCMSSRLPA